MVLSILVLATLIFVTPTLIGRPSAELASLPLLIVGMPRNESYFIIYLSAAVQAYRYEEVRIVATGSNPSANATVAENEPYGLHSLMPAQGPSHGSVTIHAYRVDHSKTF